MILATGVIAGAASAFVAAALSRRTSRHAARPMNAVAHIYDGGEPSGADGQGHRNTVVGTTIHLGASIWWAAFFEIIFGRRSRSSARWALAGGAGIAAIAYLVDYYIVAKRFRPGFEKHLSGPQMFCVYASLAAGFASSAQLSRLRNHQIEDRDESGKGRPAKSRPDQVVAPE